MTGKLYGISLGPGDPELLTLRARRILASVPVVAVPEAQAEEGGTALRMVMSLVRPEQKVIRVRTPMTRHSPDLEEAWEEGAEKLLGELRQGRDVAFVTLGDAGLYSTYGYLARRILAIAPEVPVETVPGVPSFCAAAAKLNLPLASGREPLVIVPVLEDARELRPLLRAFPNLVLLKIGRRYRELAEVLEGEGRLDGAAMVIRCGLEGETVVPNLKEFDPPDELDYLSLIIVKGESRP